MRVMILGSGGREHALAHKMADSSLVEELYALPGSAGMREICRGVEGDPEDIPAVLRAASERGIDLVVVGPEAPLAAGVVDALGELGIAAFGPTGEAARLESSKVYAKEAMVEAGVPTARFEVFDDPEAALAHVEERPLPMVIKADGLAAGKGVTVAATRAEARRAVSEAMVEGRFADAGSRVLIEDCLRGSEISVMAISDGESVLPLAPARDYKAAQDGDVGPNTGGMGCVSPVPDCDDALVEEVRRDILVPVIDLMRRRGHPFSGVLYAGLMLTAEGPMVLEFNCRFGDPETQVVLPRMTSDLVPLLIASAGMEGAESLSELDASWTPESAVCVVMASEGYPGSYERGVPITGLDKVEDGAWIFHAGTNFDGKRWVTDGGRVLGVTALGPDAGVARRRAYEIVEGISFAGAHYRRDIAR